MYSLWEILMMCVLLFCYRCKDVRCVKFPLINTFEKGTVKTIYNKKNHFYFALLITIFDMSSSQNNFTSLLPRPLPYDIYEERKSPTSSNNMRGKKSTQVSTGSPQQHVRIQQ